MTARIEFNPFISSLHELRRIFDGEGKHLWAEYCYHMISVMMETDKVLNGVPFSPRYIEEHTFYLAKYSKQIADEEGRSYDR